MFAFVGELLLRASWLVAQAGELAGNEPVANQAVGAEPLAVEPAAAANGNIFIQFLSSPINLILVSAILFMFIVVRPQQKQLKEQQKALKQLKKNDRVVTASGIHGTVVQSNADESVVTIRIDENSGARMTVNRESIAKIVNSDTKE